MRPLIAAALGGLSGIVIAHAKADFALLPSSAPAQRAATDIRSPDHDNTAKVPKAPASGFAIARGFGEQVPLSFAVRQIVPASVKVHYGKTVDQTTPVDWKGGRPWNAVLWSAIHPLGLHLVLKDGGAWITN